MNRATVRTARKPRQCGSCHSHIKAGDRYIEHVASPWDDTSLNGDRWARVAECVDCARRYGRLGEEGVA